MSPRAWSRTSTARRTRPTRSTVRSSSWPSRSSHSSPRSSSSRRCGARRTSTRCSGCNAMETGYSVALDVFEGPLDLLLHLVKKHELSILDIPISFVTEKYLDYLDAMTGLDIDVAGEYLVMAATLCHIKSRELLPSPEPLEDEGEPGDGDDEGVDPRADLIKRLLEYQKYKEAAEQLGGRPVVGRNVWGRGTATEDAVAEGIDPGAVAPLAGFPVHKLIEAFDRVMQQAKVKVSHEVMIDRLSVSQKIAELTDRLEREGR